MGARPRCCVPVQHRMKDLLSCCVILLTSCNINVTLQVKVTFPRNGSKATPPHPSGDFKWKDYCPCVFQRLRDVFSIDLSAYMMSICGAPWHCSDVADDVHRPLLACR